MLRDLARAIPQRSTPRRTDDASSHLLSLRWFQESPRPSELEPPSPHALAARPSAETRTHVGPAIPFRITTTSSTADTKTLPDRPLRGDAARVIADTAHS